MSFSRLSAGPHRRDRSAVVDRIWSPAIGLQFAGLEPTGLCYLAGFAGKMLGCAHANLDALRPSNATEWALLAAEYIRKTCCSIRHRQVATEEKKKGPSLNIWTGNIPTRSYQYFSGLPLALKRHEGLCIEKMQFSPWLGALPCMSALRMMAVLVVCDYMFA